MQASIHKDHFDLQPERRIADTAYGSAKNLGWLFERGIAPHIPVLDQSGRKDGTWSRADFEWDAENDQYVCPEGQWHCHINSTIGPPTGNCLLMSNISYAHYRFSPAIIQRAVWLYFRFPLSFRDIEEILVERGIDVSYETIRRWV